MALRQGFFESDAAFRQRARQAAQAERAFVRAQGEAERARAAAERARVTASRAQDKERARLEKEAARLHVESRLAEVASLNAELAGDLVEIDSLLAAALQTSSYVDLEELKINRVVYPPFDPGQLGVPTPPMPALVYPPEPVYAEPPAVGGLFGAKKKHAEAVARARADHEQAHRRWRDQAASMHAAYVAEQARRRQAEVERLRQLAVAEARYQDECRQVEAEAAARNENLTRLINDLAFDVESAIREYVGIVLSNSVYPDSFSVGHAYVFDLASRELGLTVMVPPPSAMPSVKEYRYVKAQDEITPVPLAAKARKDRYAGAVCQVALRTLKEIFEADRTGKIHSVALTVGTEALSPATGRPETVPFVIVGTDSATFSQFDLTNVVPLATLEHLGAAVSKSPYDLKPADTSRGVRVRGQ